MSKHSNYQWGVYVYNNCDLEIRNPEIDEKNRKEMKLIVLCAVAFVGFRLINLIWRKNNQ